MTQQPPIAEGLQQVMGASALPSGSRASTEPCSTVSALTGFDPSRKNDTFQVQMDLKRRRSALEGGEEAVKALYWLYDYGLNTLSGSDYGSTYNGGAEAEFYLRSARKHFAKQVYEHAVSLALADVEGAYASAIEARSDATPKSDAAEGESAVGNAETPKGYLP